ncbi:hypothetical protein CYMTET_29430 [Cymbomonas tetramitiformis]|uniref:Uncharacterized protein n=1 Tax=Cymbomonas tetramitiformis TaxID=36881 RepID=A0AAE0FLG3_9CHLO|nr:hypothetical protein CYMTET_29430 [Cymbomonas tetramitiformis]
MALSFIARNAVASYNTRHLFLPRHLTSQVKDDISQGLPEVTEQIDTEQAAGNRAKIIQQWLETHLGSEKANLAKILGEHKIAVRGGREEADALMDALINWKKEGIEDALKGDSTCG